MKKIYPLIAVCFVSCILLRAQATNGNSTATFFDPERNPVALRSDTSIQLVVSEFILAKSVAARLGKGCQVTKTYRSKSADGTEYLLFEGNYPGAEQHRFTLEVPLVPDAAKKYYYTATQAMICEKAGCSNCSISNGKCIGCCADQTINGSPNRTSITGPLLKVPINTD